jgi:hypothetical protein
MSAFINAGLHLILHKVTAQIIMHKMSQLATEPSAVSFLPIRTQDLSLASESFILLGWLQLCESL